MPTAAAVLVPTAASAGFAASATFVVALVPVAESPALAVLREFVAGHLFASILAMRSRYIAIASRSTHGATRAKCPLEVRRPSQGRSCGCRSAHEFPQEPADRRRSTISERASCP